MKKRIICLVIALAMVIAMMPAAFAADPTEGLSNFKAVNKYTEGLFPDVRKGDWFAPNVQAAYELGLMQGNANGTFAPNGNITVIQTIVTACRIHSIYNTGSANFVQGSPWYQVYVDYAVANGIIEEGEYPNLNINATRAQFAMILTASVPKSVLNPINSIEIGSIHDLPANTKYAEAAYLLYNAGVLTGSDSYGTFKANTGIKRSEAAAIATRIVDTSLRKSFTPAVYITEAPVAVTVSDFGSTRHTVTDQWGGIISDYSEKVYEPGQCSYLKIEMSPKSAYSGITWTSSDPSVASVDQFGRLEVYKQGEATITATAYNGVTGIFYVRVPNPRAELQYALTADGKGYEIVGCDPAAYTAHIPSTWNGLPVISIKGGAFKDCEKLRYFTVDQDQATFYEEGGVVFTDRPEKTLVVFPPCYDVADNYHVPSDTVAVASYAFAGMGGSRQRSAGSIYLQTITLPEGVKTLGDRAFFEARRQVMVYLPRSLTQIGKDLLLNQRINVPFYAYPDSDALAYARANQLPCAIIRPFEGEKSTVEMKEPESQSLVGATFSASVVEVPEQRHCNTRDYIDGDIERHYDLSAYEETTDGEVRLMIANQWSEIVPDVNGRIQQGFSPQDGLYGAGYTEGSAVLRAYDRLGNLVGLMQISGNFAFSFPGAAELGVEGGSGTRMTIIPVKPIFISSAGYYRVDSEKWDRLVDGNISQYFVVMLEYPTYTSQTSMDLALLSTSFKDCVTEDPVYVTSEPVAHYMVGQVRSFDASRVERLDVVSISFDGMECLWEDENLRCLIAGKYGQDEEFGRKVGELLKKVKKTMIGTYFPETIGIGQISVDSNASTNAWSGHGNISLSGDIITGFSESILAHEMVHAIDQQIPNIASGKYAPTPWMEGRAEYIEAVVSNGKAYEKGFDWSYLSKEDREDFFHYYYYSTNRFTEYDVGYQFFYYLCSTYGDAVSVEIMDRVAELPVVPELFEDTKETIEARAQMFKQCVEAATEVGVFQNFVRDVIEK